MTTELATALIISGPLPFDQRPAAGTLGDVQSDSTEVSNETAWLAGEAMARMGTDQL